MENIFLTHIALLLGVGLIAGWVCKRLNASPLIGYLVVGALVGPGGFDLTGSKEMKRALNDAVEEAVELDPDFVETHRLSVDMETIPGKTTAGEDAVSAADKTKAEPTKNFVGEELAEEIAERERRVVEIQDEIRKDEFAFEATTEFGVLLLLFAIGVEFTFDKLAATARYMFVGGSLQMGLTILISIAANMLFGMSLTSSFVLGCVVALSSTALVYRSVQDVGQADTKRAQATVGLLIFQDLALVPLLLILPKILGAGADESGGWFANSWVDMAAKSAAFCGVVALAKGTTVKLIAPRLAALRSNELVILFAVFALLGMCCVAEAFGLTPALGALAAGVALGENRLTRQIDALVLPFREAFSAIFFISLGMMTDFSYVWLHPLLCASALVGAVALKWAAAAAALRTCGMDFRGALAFGLSISQVGELAFMILSLAYAQGALSDVAYQTTLFVSVASLALTPNMVKFGMTKLGMEPEAPEIGRADADLDPDLAAAINSKGGHAVVIGVGHIGGSLAEELTTLGKSVCLIDMNPVNLQPFAQRGIATVVGDGSDAEILREAGAGRAEIIVVTAPRDEVALNVVRACQQANPTAVILARARYRLNVQPMKRAGAEFVFCEENKICVALLNLVKEYTLGGAKAGAAPCAVEAD
ncbi:MAG: cation:proton antiporter [Thermoguttaceae bacterium]|nr:cation:proton antiporter [Thermoguttaceae bacterium]